MKIQRISILKIYLRKPSLTKNILIKAELYRSKKGKVYFYDDELSDDNSDDQDKSDKQNVITDEQIDLMKKNYSFPAPDDPEIQYKLYKKRELFYNRILERPNISKDTDYDIVKDYRDNTCGRPFTLHDHQSMLSNLINPDTPYRGAIVFHGLGTGTVSYTHLTLPTIFAV